MLFLASHISNLLSLFFLNYSSCSLVFKIFASSSCAFLLLSSPSLVFSVFPCLCDSLLLIFIFHSSHPLFISFSSSSLLLGSLLTLLNVRAQTSPCRAAPSHRGQKQLVSLPFPCFLAASVCLTVCLLTSALSFPVPFIRCLSQVRAYTNISEAKLLYRQEFGH